MTLEEEKKLVEKAKKDPEAFGRFYDEYYPIFSRPRISNFLANH